MTIRKDSRFFWLEQRQASSKETCHPKVSKFSAKFLFFSFGPELVHPTVALWHPRFRLTLDISASLFSHYCITILFKFGVSVVKSKNLQNVWGQIMRMRRNPTAAAEETKLAVKLIPFFNRVLTTTVKNERMVISFLDLNSFCQTCR